MERTNLKLKIAATIALAFMFSSAQAVFLVPTTVSPTVTGLPLKSQALATSS